MLVNEEYDFRQVITLRRLKTPHSIRKSLMYSNTRSIEITLRRLKTPHVIRSFLIFSKIKISETKDRSPHFDTIKQYKCLYFEYLSIKDFNFMRLASLVSKGSGIRFRMKLRHSIGVFCLRSVMHRRMFNAHFYAFLCFYAPMCLIETSVHECELIANS